MKKAKCAIVTYIDNTICDYKILTSKGDFIRLTLADKQSHTFKEMLQYIVNLAKMNGYEIQSTKMFNVTFYNIALIDLDTHYIVDTLSI